MASGRQFLKGTRAARPAWTASSRTSSSTIDGEAGMAAREEEEAVAFSWRTFEAAEPAFRLLLCVLLVVVVVVMLELPA